MRVPSRIAVEHPIDDQPANFVFIITDQQRADYLGCTGHPVLRTPHIDAIAARGTRFDRCYVANPVYMPNRAALLTGRLSSVIGQRRAAERQRSTAPYDLASDPLETRNLWDDADSQPIEQASVMQLTQTMIGYADQSPWPKQEAQAQSTQITGRSGPSVHRASNTCDKNP